MKLKFSFSFYCLYIHFKIEINVNNQTFVASHSLFCKTEEIFYLSMFFVIYHLDFSSQIQLNCEFRFFIVIRLKSFRKSVLEIICQLIIRTMINVRIYYKNYKYTITYLDIIIKEFQYLDKVNKQIIKLLAISILRKNIYSYSRLIRTIFSVKLIILVLKHVEIQLLICKYLKTKQQKREHFFFVTNKL